jgi:hypothetical protein
VPPGERVATQKIGAGSRLRIVDAILSGTHERGVSHHDLLRAFVGDEILDRIDEQLNAHDYRTHEFGDSVFIERRAQLPHFRAAMPSAASIFGFSSARCALANAILAGDAMTVGPAGTPDAAISAMRRAGTPTR